MPERAPAGWHPDPGSEGGERYWNGREWSRETRPASPLAGGHWSGPERRHHTHVVFGWITAFLLPPVGLLLGIWLLRTEARKQGIAIVVTAAVILALAVLGGMTDEDSPRADVPHPRAAVDSYGSASMPRP